MPDPLNDNLLFRSYLGDETLGDDLIRIDEQLAELAQRYRPSEAALKLLNDRIVAASVQMLPVPAPLVFDREAAAGLKQAAGFAEFRAHAARRGRFAMAAAILLVLSVGGFFMRTTPGGRGSMMAADLGAGLSTGLNIGLGSVEEAPSESEAVLMALMKETRPRAMSSLTDVVDAGSVAAISPVLSTRSASYDDFASEMEAMLGEASGPSL